MVVNEIFHPSQPEEDPNWEMVIVICDTFFFIDRFGTDFNLKYKLSAIR